MSKLDSLFTEFADNLETARYSAERFAPLVRIEKYLLDLIPRPGLLVYDI